MSDNKKIRQCSLCDDFYCMNCSDNDDWLNFCSEACEKLAASPAPEKEDK